MSRLLGGRNGFIKGLLAPREQPSGKNIYPTLKNYLAQQRRPNLEPDETKISRRSEAELGDENEWNNNIIFPEH